jgi:ABC-2 type transport system ATP-binding protein
MSGPAVEARGLCKSYGGVRALAGVDLTVPEGSFFGLLGPNGAGKTTFIETLVGLVRADGGTARVFGHDVEEEYRQARDAVGLAPQEFNVDRFFPIHEVLEHKAGYHGVPADEARRRADEALRRVGIHDKRETRFDWLSGGMKRRFMLARALVTDPDLLVLDEPTAGVDVQLRRDLWETVTELNETGTTVLLTTHYIEEAERLCDEVAILDDGRVVEVASPDDLIARGVDRIAVTLADPPATPPAITAGGDLVREVTLEGDRVVVTAEGGGAVVPDLVRELDRTGHEVLDLEVERPSLEEVFVSLTRRAAGADTIEGGGESEGEGESEPTTDEEPDRRPADAAAGGGGGRT